jgi:hypothetical protein
MAHRQNSPFSETEQYRQRTAPQDIQILGLFVSERESYPILASTFSNGLKRVQQSLRPPPSIEEDTARSGATTISDLCIEKTIPKNVGLFLNTKLTTTTIHLIYIEFLEMGFTNQNKTNFLMDG